MPKVTVHFRIDSTYCFWVTVFGAIFLPRWRQTTSSKSSRTSAPCSSTPRTVSTVPGPISWPPWMSSTISSSTARASATASSSPSSVTRLPRITIVACEPLAQRVEHAVTDGRELRRDVVGNRENFLHPPSV